MEELENRISRRRMLKRVGAGAAIAWSAPILSSLRTPAFANYVDRCPETCQACPPEGCGSDERGDCFCFPTCNNPPGQPCGEGPCVCVSPRFCNAVGLCNTDAECPDGEVCIASCCPRTTAFAGTCGLRCGDEGPATVGEGPKQSG